MENPPELLGCSAPSSPRSLHIPDLLADWPWQRMLNPFYEEVAAESNAWFWSFSTLNPKSRHAFERYKVDLFAGLSYSDVTADQLRTCIDMMNVLFLIEEYTNVDPVPRVRKIVDIGSDALRNPSKPRPSGEIIVGEMLRQFWERGQRTVNSQGGELFVTSVIEWMHSLVTHAQARDSGEILTVDAYRAIRSLDVGVLPMYALARAFLLIPEHLNDNPLHAKMESLGIEIIAGDNDFVSYNREQALDDAFNIITVTMHHDGLSLDDAIHSLKEQNAELTVQYLQCHREFCTILEQYGDKDEASRIRRYLDAMGYIRRANWCWSFESGRYFGERGSTYAAVRMVPLVPKVIWDKTPRENDIDILSMEEELAKL